MRSMKYLMYKDWFEIDHFYHEIDACRTRGNLNFSLHRFYMFLTTLIREVNKRAILSNHPFERTAVEPLDGSPGVLTLTRRNVYNLQFIH